MTKRCVLLDGREFSDEALESLTDALKTFNVNLYNAPQGEGSDCYCLVLSSSPLTKAQVKKAWDE